MINYIVQPIEFGKKIISWISSRHYSGTCPKSTKFAFGLFDDEKMIGVCLFGAFTRKQAMDKYQNMLELTRLFIEDGTPKNTESYFIGYCLRYLKSNTKLDGIISYADPNVGHAGVIYKASNFKYLGQTKGSYHYIKDGRRLHIRQVWQRAKEAGITEREQAAKENLQRISDEPKHIYFFKFNKKVEDPIVAVPPNKIYRNNFFNKWTRKSAWIYGLILGDGHIHLSADGGRIIFVGNEDTVLKFKRILKIDKKPEFKRGVYHTYFDSKPVAEWFRARGVGAKKKIANKFPDDIPDEFMWDFARGLIDSDGTFNFTKDNRFSLGFSSANKQFIEDFKKFLKNDSTLIVGHSTLNDKYFTQYSFKFGEVNSISILDKIYDCPKEIRNEVRYEKYLKAKASYELKQNSKCSLCDEKAYSGGYCYRHMMLQKKKVLRESNKCSFDSCEKPYFGEGYCMEHFFKLKKAPDIELIKILGPKIRDARKKAGITQKAAGAALGVSQAHYAKIELTQAILREGDLEKLSALFGVSIT